LFNNGNAIPTNTSTIFNTQTIDILNVNSSQIVISTVKIFS
jgi:hypothetical protein